MGPYSENVGEREWRLASALFLYLCTAPPSFWAGILSFVPKEPFSSEEAIDGEIDGEGGGDRR